MTDSHSKIYPLTPNLESPKIGDTLYLVGCPYIEEYCKQNIYKIVFAGFDEEISSLTFSTSDNIDFSGFSGAPILNEYGEVVCVLTSRWNEGVHTKLAGTSIKEIEKIK